LIKFVEGDSKFEILYLKIKKELKSNNTSSLAGRANNRKLSKK